MFFVMLLYFIVSMMFSSVKHAKLEFEYIFNSFFFVIAFGAISYIYSLITDNSVTLKAYDEFKTNLFGCGVMILYVMYVLNDTN